MAFLMHKINKGHRVTGIWLNYESKVTSYSDVTNLTNNGLIINLELLSITSMSCSKYMGPPECKK